MDRSLQHYLRTADILFTLANWQAHARGQSFPAEEEEVEEKGSLYDKLVEARRALRFLINIRCEILNIFCIIFK
jgi:hypothetical protein